MLVFKIHGLLLECAPFPAPICTHSVGQLQSTPSHPTPSHPLFLPIQLPRVPQPLVTLSFSLFNSLAEVTIYLLFRKK